MFLESFSRFPFPCWVCGGQLLASSSIDQAGLTCENCACIMTFRENLPELLKKLEEREKNKKMRSS